MGPGVSLTLCCFVVYSTRRFVLCLSDCHFVLVFFSPFSIAITSLGEERANLSAFRTFVRFVLVWICRSGKGCGLWLWHSLDFSLTFFLRLKSVCFFFFFVNQHLINWIIYFRNVFIQWVEKMLLLARVSQHTNSIEITSIQRWVNV